MRSQGLKAVYRSGRTRRTASNQISYAGLQNRAPQVVIASCPPRRTMRHSSATWCSMSGTKKIPNTDDCVKMTIGKTQARHVPTAELHTLQPCGLGFGLSEFEEFPREMDCDASSARGH